MKVSLGKLTEESLVFNAARKTETVNINIWRGRPQKKLLDFSRL